MPGEIHRKRITQHRYTFGKKEKYIVLTFAFGLVDAILRELSVQNNSFGCVFLPVFGDWRASGSLGFGDFAKAQMDEVAR